MTKPSWRTKLKKTWRRLRRSLLVTGPIVALTLWLVFQHKPDWYRPVQLTESQRRVARRDATRRADAFGDSLVNREPFEVVLAEEELTRWLSVTPSLWPRSEEAELCEPAVQFSDDLIRLGVMVDRNGWRAVIGAGIECGLTPDGRDVTLRLVKISAGSLPIPRALMAWVQRAPPDDASRGGNGGSSDVESLLLDIQSVDDLRSGVSRPNWFVWPNGERPFSIDSLSIEPGRIRLGIRPR